MTGTPTYSDSPFETVEDAQAAFAALPEDSAKALVVSIVDAVTRKMDRSFGALDNLLTARAVGDVQEKLEAVRIATEALVLAVGEACGIEVIPARAR